GRARVFFFSSRRRHTRLVSDWTSDVCSSDLIPTNKDVVRTDQNDVVFRTKREKYAAIIDEIVECHERGQPVLVGTVNVEVSELQIGRASCRETGWRAGGGGGVKETRRSCREE